MKTYLFPGQGSQFKGMGAALFDAFPGQVRIADKILGYSIEALCVHDPHNRLNQTEYTQPALYVVNALSYRRKMKNAPETPDFLAGHSLGEYNALEAAGAISFENGLKMVKKRGELMGTAPKGAMAAMIGPSGLDIRNLLDQNGLDGVDVANFNSPGQTVISGLTADIEKACACCKKEKIRHVLLNTSGAFHSRYMEPARVKFHNYLKRFKFSRIRIPVISNIHARPYQQDEILSHLANQITHPVQWTESMRYLMQQGDMMFEELGVGKVLTNLVSAIQKHDRMKTDGPASRSESAVGKTAGREDAEKAPAQTKVPAMIQEKKDRHPGHAQDWEHERAALQKKVEDWNRRYPVGTSVFAEGYETELETRSEAIILFGRRAAIYLNGFHGYFPLDEVTPA